MLCYFADSQREVLFFNFSYSIFVLSGISKFTRYIRKMFPFPRPVAIVFQALWAFLSPVYVLVSN